MGFFFSHCKGLYGIFDIIVEENQTHDKPTQAYLIESLLRIGTNHHNKLNNALHSKLTLANNLLTTEDIEANVITWHPYTSETLPPHLHDQIKYRTVVAPLFCYNHVEHHLPHLVAKQFEALDQVDLTDVGSDLTKIKFKENNGDKPINFQTHYNKEMLQWEKIDNRLAENNHPSQASTPEPETPHHLPTSPHTTTSEVGPTNSQVHLSEQEEDENGHDDGGAHKFQSVCIILGFRFDSPPPV